MPYRSALSLHPVSSHATGDVVGRMLETGGAEADVMMLLVTPGHRGALEDIARTVRALLRPDVLLAAVTTGVGADGDYVERGPGIGLWAASGGTAVATGGPDGLTVPPGFDAVGGIVLTTGPGRWERAHRTLDGHCETTPGGGSGTSSRRVGDGRPAPGEGMGPAVVTGQVDGPLLLGGHTPGAEPVGVAFGPGYRIGTALAAGLRAVGPPLRVTRAERHMLYELDDVPALQQLLEVTRDRMPAVDRSRLAEGLHLEVATAGSPPSAGPPLAVLGADRTNGAMAVAGDLERGMVVRFAAPDPAAVAAALQSSLVGSAGAVLLAAPGHGHRLVDPMAADEAWDPTTERSLPMATLTCATTLQHRWSPMRSEPRSETTVAAYFA